MVTSLKKLFRSPDFDDLEMAAQSRSVQIILFGLFVLTTLFLIYTIFFPPSGQIIIAFVALVLEIVLFVFVQLKRIRLASRILTSLLWMAIIVEVALYGGIRDTGFGAFAAIILIAGLTIGTRASIIFAALTIIAGTGLAFAEYLGLLPAYASVPISSVLLSHSIILIAIALLVNLAIRNIAAITRKGIANENSEEEMKALVASSQAELGQGKITLEKNNDNLQNITAVSRLTTQVKTEKELLELSAKLLMEMYKLDYVGFYIIDQMEESAIPQGFRGQAGQSPLTLGDTLSVNCGESSSLPLEEGTLRVTIGSKNYFIDLPKNLPEMKTNLVYPLPGIDKLMGLINIQTSSIDLLDMEKQTIQILTNQIATSMSNIRLFYQLQSRVQEVGVLAGGAVRSAWDQLGVEKNIGYAYDRLQVLPTNETFPPEVAEKLRSGKAVSFVGTDTPIRARLAAPIILRDAIIGVIGYDSNIVDHVWQEEEKALLETVAARVSLALENARLFEETTRRADRERTVSEITTRIRSVSDPEVMVQTALDELKHALGAKNIQIRPYSPTPVIQASEQEPVLKKQKPDNSADVS